MTVKRVWPSATITASASGFGAFAAQWLAYIIPCQRFTRCLAASDA
jgi:hypothetical protein